jgi:hypothetical protein
MKKIVLFASAFIFSLAVMAQTETKPKPEKPVNKLQTRPVKDQTVKTTKTTPSVIKPQAATQVQQGPSPDELIKVNTDTYNFGKIKQGVPVTYYFELKNISSKPVVVENSYATCGCTTPDKIVEPIAPGATAKLKVQYNAAGIGSFTKDVHIKLAGITQEKIVHITGEVLTPEPPKEVKTNN